MELKIKSTRSELKENVLANKLEGVIKWAVGNFQTILFGLGVIVIGALIASVFIIRKTEAKEKNWVRLAQAQAFLRQKDFMTSQKILSDIKRSGSNTTESLYASYYSGEIALLEKKFDEAISFYSEVVSKSGQSPLKPLALTNLAFAYEENGDFQTAVQTYKQFMNGFAEHFLAPRNQLEWGRVLVKTGDIEAAKETLGQLIDLYPTSPWAENARQIMDKLATR